jgi:hypothetical protein
MFSLAFDNNSNALHISRAGCIWIIHFLSEECWCNKKLQQFWISARYSARLICVLLCYISQIQGDSNMTGTDLCVNKPHKSRSYLNHLVYLDAWEVGTRPSPKNLHTLFRITDTSNHSPLDQRTATSCCKQLQYCRNRWVHGTEKGRLVVSFSAFLYLKNNPRESPAVVPSGGPRSIPTVHRPDAFLLN